MPPYKSTKEYIYIYTIYINEKEIPLKVKFCCYLDCYPDCIPFFITMLILVFFFFLIKIINKIDKMTVKQAGVI